MSGECPIDVQDAPVALDLLEEVAGVFIEVAVGEGL